MTRGNIQYNKRPVHWLEGTYSITQSCWSLFDVGQYSWEFSVKLCDWIEGETLAVTSTLCVVGTSVPFNKTQFFRFCYEQTNKCFNTLHTSSNSISRKWFSAFLLAVSTGQSPSHWKSCRKNTSERFFFTSATTFVACRTHAVFSPLYISRHLVTCMFGDSIYRPHSPGCVCLWTRSLPHAVCLTRGRVSVLLYENSLFRKRDVRHRWRSHFIRSYPNCCSPPPNGSEPVRKCTRCILVFSIQFHFISSMTSIHIWLKNLWVRRQDVPDPFKALCRNYRY